MILEELEVVFVVSFHGHVNAGVLSEQREITEQKN